MQSGILYAIIYTMNRNLENNKHNYQTFDFAIAGHILRLLVPPGIVVMRALPSFEPFLISAVPEGTPVEMVVCLTERIENQEVGQTKLLSDVSIVWGDRFCFEESADYYITSVLAEQNMQNWMMYSAKDFKTSTIQFVAEELDNTSALSWFLMLQFGQAVLDKDTLLLHASVVEYKNQGYAFLGKSGTGKSTHSRLWMNHLAGFQLLNDDNPAVRIGDDNSVRVYGTPWSGKTICYRNESADLSGIVRLAQAPTNKFTAKHGVEALITLLPSSSGIRWNKTLYTDMVNTLERLCALVPVGRLECLPDESAARLCYTELEKINLLKYE